MQELSIEKTIYSVSTLNKSVKKLLESHFQIIWVEGEISNLSRPSSGHLYFTLKDETAQVRCAMFRLRNFTPPATIENGMHILACAKISLYDARGDYQLIIEHIEEKGEGVLRRQYEELKKKLTNEGLFDLNHKKILPAFPQCIGVITSASGAAIKDVLSVLNRRFSSIPVIIYPTQVQGEQAPAQIRNAILIANERAECDVLILCRGGGSLEDLWCFNDELVARTIFQSHIPIVSGVGHEVDVTIADFVADQRAATPSAAAELISPDIADYLHGINNFRQRLCHLSLNLIRQHQRVIEHLEKYFCKPERLLLEYNQMIDLFEAQLVRLIKTKFERSSQHLQLIKIKLHHLSPTVRLKAQTELVNACQKTIILFMKQYLHEARQRLSNTSRMLNTVSPLQTLERGYSITIAAGHVVESVEQVKPNDEIKIEVKNGFLECTVNTIHKRQHNN